MSNEFEDLKEVINADLAAENTEKKSIDFEGIAKMSKANLAKQDKNILLAFAEEKNLLKDLTERQKKRLTRKELADLIKPTVKRENKSAQDTNAQESINEFAIYQEAIKSALNGDYSTIDSLAQNNVMGFVNDSLNSGEETSRTCLSLGSENLTLSKYCGSGKK